MPMRQLAGCVNNGFNKRGDRYQQSREKKHWMHRDAETDCESDQQGRRRWLENCEQDFFHNASFCRSKHMLSALFGDNRNLALTARILRDRCTSVL
jgi:hypothetical protein